MIVAGCFDELRHHNVGHSFTVLRPLLAVLEPSSDAHEEHAVILGCMHPAEYILHHGNNNDNTNFNYNNTTNNNNNNNNNNNTNSNDDNDDDSDIDNNKFAFQLMMSKVCEEPWQRW